jgi:outer membrane protein assembly factor BamB
MATNYGYAQEASYQEIRVFDVPFIEEVTMPADWMQGFLSNMGNGNEALRNELSTDGLVTWKYAKHGLAPWMQFFYDWRFSDIDNDGLTDMIVYSGARSQIAFANDGTELWSHENPDAHSYEVRYDAPFPLYDIDNDGQVEFICARKIDSQMKLCIVNALTNEVEKSVPYPVGNDNYTMIRIVNLAGDSHPSEILIQLIHQSVLAYDANLEKLWEVSESDLQQRFPRNHTIMAHTQAFYDTDEDGKDEILAGSAFLDDDGTPLWVMADLPALKHDGHSDSNLITPLGSDDKPNLLTSTGGYCFDINGTLLWEAKNVLSENDFIRHGQTVRVGDIRPDIDGLEVILYDNANRMTDLKDRVLAMDSKGSLLWKFETLTPEIQEGGFGFGVGDWDGDGVNEVFINDPEKVNILNGHGEIIATLPHHLIYVMDLYGDHRVEALVLTGIGPDMKLKVLGIDKENDKSSLSRNNNPDVYNIIRY